MTRSLPTFGVPLLFVLLMLTTACDRNDASVTAPGALREMSAIEPSLGVEPRTVHPTFLSAGSCVGNRPFGASVTVVFSGDHDVILRGLRFSFIDRFGVTTLPHIIVVPSHLVTEPQGSTIPTSSPVPLPGIAALPGMSPIPIPGSSPIPGLIFAGGSSHALHYFVRFGCGVFPEGTLIVSADTGDRSGRFSMSEARVLIEP